MGCGGSTVKTNFDYPTNGPTSSNIKVTLVSPSHLYCLSQHVAEWPDYYILVDCRPKKAYDKGHILNAEHLDEVTPSIAEKINDLTLIIYGQNAEAPGVTEFLDVIETNSATPSAIFLLDGPFSLFEKKYKVIMSNHLKTLGEQPGPIELIPATSTNPAVYTIHRNQFQHCKTTVAYLGCNVVINISARRLFLKTATIRLENIQFDSVNEPYDDAIKVFTRYIEEKPKSSSKGNILIIDETGCDYGTLLVGWYWYSKGHDIEKVCEHLTNKSGELDTWYLDVLRAWTES